jgi:hypothetical protein
MSSCTFPRFSGPATTLPSLEIAGTRVRVLAGSAFGERSPVKTFSPLFYADVSLPAGRELPVPKEHEELAAYVVDGTIACGSERAERGRMLVFAPGDLRSRLGRCTLSLTHASRCCAARRSRANGTSGGISYRARSTGSSRPKRTGRKAGSRRCRATRPNSFRSRGDPELRLGSNRAVCGAACGWRLSAHGGIGHAARQVSLATYITGLHRNPTLAAPCGKPVRHPGHASSAQQDDHGDSSSGLRRVNGHCP